MSPSELRPGQLFVWPLPVETGTLGVGALWAPTNVYVATVPGTAWSRPRLWEKLSEPPPAGQSLVPGEAEDAKQTRVPPGESRGLPEPLCLPS